MAEKSAPDEEKQLMQEGLTLLRQGDLENAEATFKEFLSLYPESSLADTACYNLANICLKRQENQKALDWFDYLLRHYPDSESAYLAKDERIEIMRILGIGPLETPEERYQKGKNALAELKYDEAIKIFKSFLTDFPESDLIDNVHYNLALIYKHQGLKDKVKMHVEIILNHYPESDAATYAEELLDIDDE